MMGVIASNLVLRVPMQFRSCSSIPPMQGGVYGLIFVRHGNSDEIGLWVNACHTLDQIKAEVYKLFGIPADHQCHSWAYWPQMRRPAHRTVHLDQNMYFVRHLVADELKPGFSLKLTVTQRPLCPRYRIMRKTPAADVEHCVRT